MENGEGFMNPRHGKNLFKANCVAEYNEPMADAVM